MADYIDEYVEILKSQGKTDLEISNILLQSNEAQIEAELKKEKDPAVTTAPVGSTDLLSSTDLSSEDSSLEQPLVDEVNLTVETKPEPPSDEIEAEVLPEVKIPIKFEGFDNEDEGAAALNKAYNEYGFTTSVDFAPGTDQITVTSADNKSIQLMGKSSFDKKQELLSRQGKETQTYEDYLGEFNNFIIDNQTFDEETKNFTKLTGANINNVNLANPNVFVDDIYNIVDDLVTDPRKYGVDLGTFANRAITDYDFGRKKPEIIDATKEELIRRYPEADSDGIDNLIAQTLGKNDVIFSNVFSNKKQQESLQTKQDLEENIFSQESIDKYKEHAGLGGPFKEAVEALKTGDMTAAREAFSKARFQTKQIGRSKYSKKTEYQPDTFWSTEDFENKSIFPGNESVEVKKAKYNASRAYFQDVIKRTSPPKEHPAVSLDRTLNKLVKENFVRYNNGNNNTITIPRIEGVQQSRMFFNTLYRDGIISDKNQDSVELNFNQIAKYEDQGDFFAPQFISKEDKENIYLDYKAYREYGIQLKNDLNAVSDLLYNNLDPASLKASSIPAKIGLFAESAVDATIDMVYGSQTLNDWDNDRAIAERYKEAQRIHNAADPKNPISFTKEQTDAMGMTMMDNVVSGVGAFVPMAIELAVVHAAMGPVAGAVAAQATGLARVLNAGSKIQKGAAHVVKFAFEEGSMQAVGFRAGSGGTFYAVGQGISGWNPFKKRFGYLRPFFDKVVKSGVSGGVSLEAAGVVETFIEDLGGHADFNKFLDENYADYTEVGKRVLTNYLTFSAFGLKSLNTKDFKSNAEIRKTATEAFEKGDIETGYKLWSFADYRGVNEQFDLNTNEGRQSATDHISNLYKEMGHEGPVNIEYNVSADMMGKGNEAEFSMIKGVPTIKIKEGIDWANANLRHEMTHGMFEVAFKGNEAAKKAFFNSVDKAVRELVVDPEFKKITGVDLEFELKEKYGYKKGTAKYNEEAVTSIIELLSRKEVLESSYAPTILKSLKNDVVEIGKNLNIGQTKLETGQDLINFLGRFVKSDIFGEGTKEMRQLIDLQLNNAPTPQQVQATKAYNVKFNSKEFADISKKNYEIISALQGKGETTGKKSLPQMIVESDKAGKDAMVQRMLEDYGGTIEQAYKDFEAGTGGLDPITKARYENEFFELNGALVTNELKYFDESKGGTREDYIAETKNNLLDLARTYKTNPFYILENGETVDTTKYNKKKMSEFLEKNPTAFNDLSTPNPVDFGGYAVRMLNLRRPAIFEKFKTVKQQEDFYNVSLDTAENAEQILQGAVNTGYSGTTEGATRTLKDINKKQIDLVNKLDLNNEGFEDKVRSIDINDYTFNQKNVITVDDIIKSTGVAVVKPNGKISPKATNEALVKWFGLDGKPNVDAEAKLKAFYNTMPQQYYTRSENITETSAATGIPKWIVSNLMVETGERLNVKTAQQKGGEGTYAAGKIRELVSYPEFKEILTKTFDGAAPQKLNTVMQNLLKVISGNVTNTELRKLNKDVLNANEVALLRDGTNDLLASRKFNEDKKFRDLGKDNVAFIDKLFKKGSDYDQNRQSILDLSYELDNARKELDYQTEFNDIIGKDNVLKAAYNNNEQKLESRNDFREMIGSAMNYLDAKLVEGGDGEFTKSKINKIYNFSGGTRTGLVVDANNARKNAKNTKLEVSEQTEKAFNEIEAVRKKYIKAAINNPKFEFTSASSVNNLGEASKKDVFNAIKRVQNNTETKQDIEFLKIYREYARAVDFGIQNVVYDAYNQMKKTSPEKADKALYYYHKSVQGESNIALRGLSGFRYIEKGASLEKQYLEHLKPRLFASAADFISMINGTFNKETFEQSRQGFEGAIGTKYAYKTVMDGIHLPTSNQEIYRYLGNEKLAKNTIDLLTGKTVWQTMQEAGATKYVKQYKKYQDLLRKTAKNMGVEVENKNDYEVWQGVKEASLEAKVKASKKFKEEKPRTVKEFNGIIKRATGQDMRVKIDEATARIEGAGKKGTWFVPYSNEDFAGLMYPLYGKGKQGNADMAFIKENLLDKFNEGEFAIATERAMISDKMNKINASFKNLNVGFHKMLRKPIEEGSAFNNQHAARVWIWNQMGVENIPGLKFASEKKLLSVVENNAKLKEYAATILESNGGDYPSPEKYWESGSIAGDFLKAFQGTKRKEHLGEWMQNIDAFFTPETMNRLQAKFGTNYVNALKGSIKAMKRGTNRTPSGDNKFDKYLDYVNNSVGAVMFLNTKSAVLQSLSAVNYINFTDNNPVAIGRVMSNPKEFTKTFNELWNSDYLVGRRDGLKINVSEAEVAQMLEGGTGSWFNTVTGKAIKLGFTPTRLMDSFAIAFGGTTFFINRQKTYLKQGMTPEKAKEAATKDWIALSEEAQQSSRTDRISADQRGNLGRLVLAFANTPIQYNRLMKKALLDLKDGRGNKMTNISKALYYGALQNIIFSTLQQGLFSVMFNGDDSSDKEVIDVSEGENPVQSSAFKAASGTMDTFLRGLGPRGAVIYTLKNMALKTYTESLKDRPEYDKAAYEVFSISPPIKSKVTKLRQGYDVFTYDIKTWEDFTAPIESFSDPRIFAALKFTSAFTNVGVDRASVFNSQIQNAMNDELSNIQRIGSILGWQSYELGIKEDKKLDLRKPKKGLYDFDLDLNLNMRLEKLKLK